MKSFIVVLALAALASADVSHIVKSASSNERDAPILEQSGDVAADGFVYLFKTGNGITGQARGYLTNPGKEDEALAVEGSNQYYAPDGTLIDTSYVADANGYRAVGAHLPTPPAPLEIPEYIARSLAYIAAHPPKPESERKA